MCAEEWSGVRRRRVVRVSRHNRSKSEKSRMIGWSLPSGHLNPFFLQRSLKSNMCFFGKEVSSRAPTECRKEKRKEGENVCGGNAN